MKKVLANTARPMVKLLALAILVTLVLAAPRRAAAEEPAREFLDALRDMGYYDVALEFLDRAPDNPAVPVEFKEIVLYEKGLTLIEGSRYERDIVLREKQLDQAKLVLDQFIAERATHAFASSAKSQLANLLVERARINIERANRKSTATAEKTKLMDEARTMYKEARQVFSDSLEDLKTKLGAIQIQPGENKSDPLTRRLIETRDRYRADYLQAKLLVPAIEEEMADTYAEGAPERKDLLISAAKQYDQAYTDYRTRIAGLYARMYEGRCHFKLKDYKTAISYFAELLEQPNSPEAFRTLKLKTLMLAAECWLNAQDANLYNEAILKIGPFVDLANPVEQREPDWLFLRMSLAKANWLSYQELAKKPNLSADDRKQMNVAKANAIKDARFVSKEKSDFKEEALTLLVEIGVPQGPGGPIGPPTTFADARTAGKDALDGVQSAKFTLQELTTRLASTTDATEKQDLEKQLAATKKSIEDGPTLAFDFFRRALELADSETTTDDLNVVRYFLCYLYYTRADFYDAALMGEFIARRYPSAAGARQCAQIAMASYLGIYKDNAQAADRSFETSKIMSIADYTIDKWPGQPESVDAASTMIVFMINDNKLDQALEYLAKIPVDSPKRGEAELKTGQAIWSSYLRGTSTVRAWETEGRPQAEIDAERTRLDIVKEKAKSTLVDGIERMKLQAANETVVTAALALAQVYVDTGETVKAVQLLEDKTIGPLSLLRQKHPAVQRLAIETYKAALRAYIASLEKSDATGRTAAVDKAKQVMAELKSAMGDTPEGKDRLVAIYISLAYDLKQQMDQIQKLDDKKAFAIGLASFLNAVRAGSDELNVLAWVADTFSRMGESFDTDPRNLTKEAQDYLTNAVTAFETILTKGDSQGTSWLSDDMRITIQMRMAQTKRQLRNYKDALDLFEQILKKKNSLLNLQVEAAKAYQEWAAEPRREELYVYAMMGARPDEANKNAKTIWGWGKLAQITARYPQYSDTFFEARYNLAVSRLHYGERKNEEKYRQMAKQDVLLTHKLYPDLGGNTWKPKFDRLLREIQRSLGEAETGLPAPKS